MLNLAATGIADMDLHVHFAGFDTLESNCIYMGYRHRSPLVFFDGRTAKRLHFALGWPMLGRASMP